MRTLFLPIICLLLLTFETINAQLSTVDRKMAIAEMSKSDYLLFAAVDGLSDAPLNFKSTPESWSIAECVEHIALSEINLSGMLQGALQTPADTSKRQEVKVTDEKLIAMATDRSNKVKTSEAFEPSNKYESLAQTIKAFEKKRTEHLDYIKSTEDDLRNHYGPLPFGTIDGLQILVFIAAHSERHIMQIEEIKIYKKFPKG